MLLVRVFEKHRKVEGKVVTGQAGASEPHVSLPYPARLVCRFGSATTADYDEYLAEKKIEDFWKPEVEVDSKFLPKQYRIYLMTDEYQIYICIYISFRSIADRH